MRMQMLNRYDKAKKPRRPLRTLKELAEDVGVPYLTLKMLVAKDPSGPRRVFELGEHSRSTAHAYYDPVVFMRWWRARDGK